ncbi:MAG: ribulokinase [bacterium]
MSTHHYVIGVDYGTDSVRSVIVDAMNGTEIASAVALYRRWGEGKYCDPVKNQFRQHALDYIEGLEESIRSALMSAAPDVPEHVIGLSVDTTGSTPGPVDEHGTPLSLLSGFSENPNAMFVLWKDHTAVQEAEEINRLARIWGGIDYTKFEGGIYSSEWFWAKILHVLRAAPEIREAAFSWVEHCDWIPALLTGKTDPLTMKRSRCAAGHKAMWHPSFNGLPAEEFLRKLDPLLTGVRARLFTETFTSNVAVGTLTQEWAERLGLTTNVTIGVGAFDAHMGAVGAAIQPYVLTKIMGTSTCDMLVAPTEDVGERTVRGICGQVDGSIIPGLIGLEAGQSAFGDVYAWFKDVLLWPVEHILTKSSSLPVNQREQLIKEVSDTIIDELSAAAENIPVETSGILALDWMNGRRTPDANQLLKGAITGLNLGSDTPRIFRALVEATAFGAKKIIERFRSEGVRIDGVIAIGGVAKKSPFIMQIVTDVLDVPISVPKSEQTCALGAAMFAATAAGLYPTVEAATTAMDSGFDIVYHPRREYAEKYRVLYERYNRLAEFIEDQTMKERK